MRTAGVQSQYRLFLRDTRFTGCIVINLELGVITSLQVTRCEPPDLIFDAEAVIAVMRLIVIS